MFQGMRIKRMEKPVLVGFFSVRMPGEEREIPLAYFDKVSVINYFLGKHDYGQIPIYTFDEERPSLEYEFMKRNKDIPVVISDMSVADTPTPTIVTFKKLKL
jgi:hypothetical protein